MSKKIKINNSLDDLKEMFKLNETVQQYTSESGKSEIQFETSNNDSVKIITKQIIDFKLNDLPEDYQNVFFELLEMLELEWVNLIKDWYSGDLSKVSKEVDDYEEEVED